MTTHIIKLAVGIRDVAHLESVQQERSAARGVSDTRRAYTRHKPVRPDVSLFNTVRISFDLSGVTQEQGDDLVTRFRQR